MTMTVACYKCAVQIRTGMLKLLITKTLKQFLFTEVCF